MLQLESQREESTGGCWPLRCLPLPHLTQRIKTLQRRTVCHVPQELFLLMTGKLSSSLTSTNKVNEGIKAEHYKSASYISKLINHFLNFPVDNMFKKIKR